MVKFESEIRKLQNEILLKEKQSKDQLESLLKAEKDKQFLQLRVEQVSKKKTCRTW